MSSGECIAVQVAMGIEFRSLMDALDSVTNRSETAGRSLVEGTMAGRRVILARSGLGKTMAAATAQYLVDVHRPACLLDCGTVGGLAPWLSVGSVFAAREILDEALMATGRPLARLCAGPDYQSWLGENVSASGPVVFGRLLSRELTVDDPEDRNRLWRQGIEAVDWETFSVVKVAQVNGLACVSLRVVSDLGDGTVVQTFQEQAKVFLPVLAETVRGFVGRFEPGRAGPARTWGHPEE